MPANILVLEGELSTALWSASFRCKAVVCRVGQQGHISCTFDRPCQRALVLGAVAGLAAWSDLAPLGDVTLQRGDVLVVDLFHLLADAP